MATPLIWKAYEFNEKTFVKFLYRHPLSFDISEERFRIERRQNVLIYFYIANSIVLIGLLGALYIIGKYIFLHPADLPLYKVLLKFEFACIFAVLLGLNYTVVAHGDEMFENLVSGFYALDRKIRNESRPKGYALKLSSRRLIVGGKI